MNRNDKAADPNNPQYNPHAPYFKMVLPPKEGETEWKPVLVCWKAKSGKAGAYSCKLEDDVEITFKEKIDDFPQQPQKDSYHYPTAEEENIDVSQIPFD